MALSMGGEKAGLRALPATPLQSKLSPSCIANTVAIDVYDLTISPLSRAHSHGPPPLSMESPTEVLTAWRYVYHLRSEIQARCDGTRVVLEPQAVHSI